MESKMNQENDFIEMIKSELADGFDVDDQAAYMFALNLTEALSASNADLTSIKKIYFNL